MTSHPYEIVHYEQGSAEWLSWRRSKITASMAAAAMGLDPWTTPLQLFNKILSGEETPDNERMAHGRNTEAEARAWVIHQTGTNYSPACMESVEHPWLGCSLDGWNPHAEVKAIEIKSPMKSIEQLNSMVDIPQNYFCQMQLQMAVTGIDKMYFVTYSKSSQDGVILTVKRDNLFIEKMIPLLRSFYDRLAAFDAPEPIDGRDRFETNDSETCMLARDLRMIKARIKKDEEEEKRLTEALVIAIDGKSSIIGKDYADVNCKMTKVIRKGNVDLRKIAEDYFIDLEKYRNPPTTQWRFS